MYKVGIIGCGQLGSQMALWFRAHGFEITVVVKNKKSTDKATINLKTKQQDRIWKRIFLENGVDDPYGMINVTSDYNHLQEVDLVIETITELLIEKKKVYGKIEKSVSSQCVIATNTSSLSINKLSNFLIHKERFVGLHFFNPIFFSGVIEFVKLPFTSGSSIQKCELFIHKINKTFQYVFDSPGFVVNRIIIPYILDSIKLLEGGYYSVSDIDGLIKQSVSHPIGPLETADIIGLDTLYYVSQNLFAQTGDKRYEVPRLLLIKVDNRELGKKNNLGFYKWTIDGRIVSN